MKRVISLAVTLSLLLTIFLTGCGISEAQQAFIDQVNAINITGEGYADSVVEAFLAHAQLTEKELEAEEVQEAYTKLVSYYTDLYGTMADNIVLLDAYMDAYELEKVQTLCQETLQLADQLSRIPLQDAIDQVSKEFDLATIDDAKKVLADVQALIPEICYEGTFIPRYEVYCDYPSSYIEELDEGFSYGYTTRTKLMTEYNAYKAYIDEHYSVSGTDKDEIFYDIGNGKTLSLYLFIVESWGIYALWVRFPTES